MRWTEVAGVALKHGNHNSATRSSWTFCDEVHMHSTVFVVLPVDAPDPRGMINALLEPLRQNVEVDGKRAWPYWDYWYFYDPIARESVRSHRECSYMPNEIPDRITATAVITPNGEFHDCCHPMPTQEINSVDIDSSWMRLCQPVLLKHSDHVVVTIRLHT